MTDNVIPFPGTSWAAEWSELDSIRDLLFEILNSYQDPIKVRLSAGEALELLDIHRSTRK